jgi:DNA repair exonuclease SbcCD nuclease subunit
VVHTGDLFDRSRPPLPAVDTARRLLARAAGRVPTLVMHGNHDWRGVGELLRGMPGDVHLVDAPMRLVIRGLRIAAIPFCRDARDWASAAGRLCEEPTDVILAHQGFEGSRVPGYTFHPRAHADVVPLAAIPAGVPTILTGHIHTRQELVAGPTRVLHVGSTERTAFVERNEPKGGLRWDASTGRVDWHTGATRRMVVVRSPADFELIQPADLVTVAKALQTDEAEREVLGRGGWLQPWRKPSMQQGLFE